MLHTTVTIIQQHVIYCRSTPFANTPLSHIYHNTVFTKHFPLKSCQIATTYQHIVPLPFTSYPYLQDPQTCTQIFPYTKVIMTRLNRSNDKNTIPNLKPPPPTSTSKGIPADHHTHTNTPQPSRTKSLAMAQPPSAFTDTVQIHPTNLLSRHQQKSLQPNPHQTLPSCGSQSGTGRVELGN